MTTSFFPITEQNQYQWGGSPDPRRAPSPGLSKFQRDPNDWPGGPIADAGVRPTNYMALGSAALLREQIQFTLGSHYETVFLTRKQPAEEALSSIVGEIPRGAITEIAGPAFSGRTSLLYSLLATASAGQEFCAFLDAGDTFDPESAAASGVRLSQVLWVRCGGNLEHALKAADLLAQAGGFGLVAIDFGDAP